MTIVTSIIKSYQGKNIRIREDKYVCLTDMASASGKLLANWTRTDKSKSYLVTLSSITQKSIIELIEVGEGNQPTWGHPKVAIRFAQWCSDEFAVQIDFWIDELMTTGKVELAPAPAPAPIAAHQLAIEKASAIESCLDTMVRVEQKCIGQPRRAQIVADLMMNLILEIGGQPRIAPESPQLRGVVDISSEMGYATDMSSRVRLGNYVVKHGHSGVKEKRFCNGEYRDINCYADTLDLRDTIAEFFLSI